MSTTTKSVCVLTGAATEDADDCDTHRHRIEPANEAQPTTLHTAAWRRFGGMVDGYGIVDSDGQTIIEQAAFNGVEKYGQQIVTEHNAHAALVEALKLIADKAHKGANGGLNVPGKSTSVGDCKSLMRAIRDAANSALKLAGK